MSLDSQSRQMTGGAVEQLHCSRQPMVNIDYHTLVKREDPM